MNELSAIAQDATTRLAQALLSPQQAWQWLAVVIAIGNGLTVARYARRKWTARQKAGDPHLGLEATTIGRLALTAAIAAVSLAGGAALEAARLPHPLLDVAAMLAGAMLVLRLVVAALRRILRPDPLLTASLHGATWLVWILIALWLLGWLAPLARWLDALAITAGSSRISVLDAIRTVGILLVAFVLAAYIGALLEKRILATPHISIGMRVGLGFGLQRIASNFVSGFILVADRSIR